MLIAALVLNILVLVPVSMGLLSNAPWTDAAYGPVSPARGILMSVYLAIFVTSLLLLVLRDPKMIAALLIVQIIYKLTTPFTVGSLGNPVVVSNLLIAGFHAVALAAAWTTITR